MGIRIGHWARLGLLVLLLVVTPATWTAAQDRVEVTLWHHWAGEYREGLVGEMLEAFMAEHPWIDAKHIVTGTGGAADRLTAMIIAGNAPEIVMMRSTYSLQFMAEGALLRLDDLVRRDGVDLNRFHAGDLAGFQLVGSTYALPVMSGAAWTNLMFYNRDLLAEAGYHPDDAPTTWEEWREQARRMTRHSGNGDLLTVGSQIPFPGDASHWNGAQNWSADWRTATPDNPRTIETFEFLLQLQNDVYGGPDIRSAFHQGVDRFLAGEQGIYFQNNSAFGALQAQDTVDWGAALAPVNAIHGDARPVGVASSSWAYSIPAGIPDEKLEATWLLLKYLTTHEDAAGFFARVQGRPSAIIEYNRHPDYQWENPYWDVVIAAVQHDIPAPPINPLSFVSSAGNQVLNGTNTPVQALEQARVNMQAALDEYWTIIGE